MKRPAFNTARMGVPGASSTDVCLYDDRCPNPPSDRFGTTLCTPHALFVHDRVSAFLAADELRERTVERNRGVARANSTRQRADQHVVETLAKLPGSSEAGYVYVIRLGGMVKIGFSKNPRQRIKDLPHQEVLSIREGSRLDERTAHRLCAEWRVVGEWFEDCPALRQTLQLDTPKAM